MPKKRRNFDPTNETVVLLKRLLMVQLFVAGTTQGAIARKLNLSKATVNDFLKGVKRNGKQSPQES